MRADCGVQLVCEDVEGLRTCKRRRGVPDTELAIGQLGVNHDGPPLVSGEHGAAVRQIVDHLGILAELVLAAPLILPSGGLDGLAGFAIVVKVLAGAVS